MRPVTAQWVANAVGGELAADVEAVVSSVVKDSREVRPGSLYVAFVGEHVDGHDFAHQALEAGATVCLVSQPVDAPHILVPDVTAAIGALAAAYLALLRTEGDITVVGITGSNGKTTTKDLLAQTLPQVVAPVGSFNNEIGLPLTVLSAGPDTRYLVLEMGASAPGDIAYLTRIAPLDMAVVLMVGSAHSAGYGSRAGLAAEKATILDGVVPGGVGIINADDPYVAEMTGKAPRTVTFGFGSADVVGEHRGVEAGRATFTVEGHPVRLRILGDHHAINALAAIAVARECGLSTSEAATAVSAAKPASPHRMALTERSDGVRILDDAYNASPESMRAAFRALRAVAEGGRTWAIIGEMLEMGDASIQAHDDLGIDAVRLGISHLVVVGAGARPAYVSAVREGSWGDEAAFVATIDEALALVRDRVTAGDTVLVKGSHGTGLWRLAEELTRETS
ncbi:UDP-N-acetylmuramoyl-tripeptide--D-alanyl-D-alanine ligase [Demequina sp. TTPB684]|uniref:UDP-N-acetylmuramoyl-tripeptide--D-alanyl-D- alanine ligase n=1 Tax=unclassified Demequina TaxID=2620311 RepID=UPI001CF14C36|nr:UDP-N-acetylmuramoyl-tripeptide--D-alanyl-D-alanine ligase [Demequina sp. TMPB413]MCB2411590.1 UDP-N-acetylmuramoyl-tripeptide--D-alanyl-D-alanine ligase [Demequina sp. TTPB684]UPU89569.1 UDP-N-acetylmuramoyl-tripeptide--D-alanyl-D-alanine ligase [Demequina sp. TMPB413]